MIKHLWISTILIAMLSGNTHGVLIGLNDDFSSSGLNGWANRTASTHSNPGTGGVDGASDGFLMIEDSFGNLGTSNEDARYAGDWRAAGVGSISLYLNDVGTDDDIEFHVLISSETNAAGTTWQYNTGFDPPHNSWQPYTVDVMDASNWTRIRGSLSLDATLGSAQKFHLRHDESPYFSSPDQLDDSDVGIDNISLLLVPEPSSVAMFGASALMMWARRNRRSSQSYSRDGL